MKRVTNIDIHVGKKLKLRRINLGLSQQKVGKLMKITFQQIQKYEKGENRISAGKLYKLSKILKVPIIYFFDGLDNNNENNNSNIIENIDYDDLNKEILIISRLLQDVKDKEKKKNFIDTIKNLIKFMR